ncbi:hypothetical protein MARCHEWKA_01490 [Brevundimonas phage vB_BpoS-Marchewka]|uniref:Uncharacterized protein n=1 Tax=Brevundimonas phage vB_BpoS-Marchewka TaxID=2948604 RepID=A0A9E7N529_9CAUD|nr:hypothetical protein MARCHEWKA_01490 [Brevundimonas phage vB_BpoS-Marchewka]UTC29108.1 hypothetical protein BAMBUS_00250 [Brevundimonas phage vB_BpoS-Bambus]
MSHAALKLYLVGTGWMNQTISAIETLELVRPFNGSAEARDTVQSLRRELLASAKVTAIEGLVRRDQHFGDFASITDVRMTYSVVSQGEAMGLFGASRTTTVSESTALEFNDPDSEFDLVFEDED